MSTVEFHPWKPHRSSIENIVRDAWDSVIHPTSIGAREAGS